MRRRARRLGISFVRRKTLKLPERIRIDGRWHPVDFPNERGIRHDLASLWLLDEYRLESLDDAPQTILDIGGNAGLFALLARHFYPDATIHVYEPNPDLIPTLQRNLDLPHITWFCEAIGPESGRVDVIRSGDTNQTRTRRADDGAVVMRSLDEAIQRLGGTVDFAKIDCEGGEWALFESSEAWQRIRRVAMEYHLDDHKRPEDAIAALSSLGFTLDEHVRSGADFGLLFAHR